MFFSNKFYKLKALAEKKTFLNYFARSINHIHCSIQHMHLIHLIQLTAVAIKSGRAGEQLPPQDAKIYANSKLTKNPSLSFSYDTRQEINVGVKERKIQLIVQ